MGTAITVDSLQGSRRPGIAYQAGRRCRCICTCLAGSRSLDVATLLLSRRRARRTRLLSGASSHRFRYVAKHFHSHTHTQVVGSLVSAHAQPAPTECARGQMQLMIACPWNSIHCERRDTRHLRPATSLSCATQASCESARKDPHLRCHGRSAFQRRGLSPPSDGNIKPARGLLAASWLPQSCTGSSSHIV